MFTQVDSILRSTDRVLDFGAGRGEHIIDNDVEYRRQLFDLRHRCAHVEGCDVDEAVMGNPYLHHAEVLKAGERFPYADDSFDIIISRFVYEHVEDSRFVASELLRILKPGGTIAALTPNKYGYIALVARAVPNRLHVRALTFIQPKRKAVDVFPTAYKLNSKRALRSAFGPGVEIFIQYCSGEPAYHFGNALLFRAFMWLHKYLPSALQPLLIVYVRKR
ncbi:class I SAM-dependent methyltransferase [Mycolicibacterium chubuense]|uniref:class I SAM-dependent methyltransferase n=1 Tax=Mycolicibacterium chubuense TaxID=1800 RepID=UPI0009E39BE5|nr:class I SAM-dependent methyltransferase [Mycolicibacterium chubuense]